MDTATITREKYGEFLKTFSPVEDELVGNIGRYEDNLADDLKKVESSVDRGFKTSSDIRNRNASRYGLTFNAQEKGAIDRNSALDKSLALTSGKNMARRRADDGRVQDLLTAGAMGRGLSSSAQQGMTGVAQSEAQRDAVGDQNKAASKQQTYSAIGAAAGLAAMIFM